jgi:predicted DNA-binding antitoxin AbrB/MazE fold protein
MSQEIRAVYENGLFRPLEPVSLAEHDVVSLVVGPAVVNTPSSTEHDHPYRTLREALDEAARLPLESPDDGFSGADHGRILYDWNK